MGTQIYLKYPPGHKFKGKKVLNVGCGFAQFKAPNVINLDAYDICKPDVVWDLNKAPLPFEEDTFDHIIANHILEHLPNWWDCFNDFGRILKPNGTLEIWLPGSGSDSQLGYRDHVITINHCSFFGTFGTYRNGSNAWAEENSRCWANRLKSTQRKTQMITKWWVTWAPPSLKRWMCEHLRNVIVEDGYFFRKVTEAEHREEMEYARVRTDGGELLPMLQVPPPALRG